MTFPGGIQIPTGPPPGPGKYSNTILGAILAIVGFGLIGLLILPSVDATGRIAYFGLIVLVVTTLLGTRQSESNGHRLTSVEQLANFNSGKIDTAVETAKTVAKTLVTTEAKAAEASVLATHAVPAGEPVVIEPVAGQTNDRRATGPVTIRPAEDK